MDCTRPKHDLKCDCNGTVQVKDMNSRLSNDVVRNAWAAGIVVPSFNIPYLPMMEPVIRAVRDENAFALIATAQIEWETLESKGPREVMEEFQKWEKPDCVRIHLDHICSVNENTHRPNDYYAIIGEAIAIGYPSVMIDGSHEKSLDDNIAVTRKVVELARRKGVLVEGEVGSIFGYSDETTPPYEQIFAGRIGFTTTEQAKRMTVETGLDWLSVAVGNLHGAMAGRGRFNEKIETRLDVALIAQLNRAIAKPLVIHGGSFIATDCLRGAIKNGVAKINVAKDIRQTYQLRLERSRNIEQARQAVYDRVKWLIKECYRISGVGPIVTGSRRSGMAEEAIRS
jgi:fructose-bisphosphate aldolase, class II